MNNNAAPIPAARTVMNGKPVITIKAKSIINMHSGFQPKELCDGPTFSAGTACAYTCSFCFVKAQMLRNPHWTQAKAIMPDAEFEKVVIRRESAVEIVRRELTHSNGRAKFTDPSDRRVIYASPSVDVAANMDLVRETAEICKVILALTHWHIRLLSKSNLLPKVDDLIPAEWKQRMIYGVSTGTLDDPLSTAFEQGTPRVSKRLQSLHELQDRGLRTYGMLCPSLPIPSGHATADPYGAMSSAMAYHVRVAKCEHVWAEVINVRGESMKRTVKALTDGGFKSHADALEAVSKDAAAWEEYARVTFLGHVQHIPPEKLRFLQYVTPETKPWWDHWTQKGAVLLGTAAGH